MSFHSFIGLTLPRTETSRSRRDSISGTERRAGFPATARATRPRKTMSENEAEPKGNIPPAQDRCPATGRTAKSEKKRKPFPVHKRESASGLSDALSRIWPGRAGKPRYSLIRSLYSRVRLSTRIFSPVWMNSGTRIVAPVSTVAGFSEFVEAVSPLTPGSV